LLKLSLSGALPLTGGLGPVAQPTGKRCAIQELQGQASVPLGFTDLENQDDIGVLQMGDGFGFEAERETRETGTFRKRGHSGLFQREKALCLAQAAFAFGGPPRRVQVGFQTELYRRPFHPCSRPIRAAPLHTAPQAC
jgi:hypothetical protein